LVTDIYEITSKFPDEEKFGLVSQMRRSCVSVPSNIAEGAARNSTKDYIRFLYLSIGALSEIDTQLIIASNLNFINTEEIISEEIKSLKLKIRALIVKLRKKIT
jgi:four helix bundle protein